jgi:hypothetical protein
MPLGSYPQPAKPARMARRQGSALEPLHREVRERRRGAYSMPSGPRASPAMNWRTNWFAELNS